ncbi:uncharacterized protein LOC124176184 isoform X1 [Neodiprion fabricii]|uniref:uncharacterized protein LOC124176184 isoform X1 n=2 Tax=Neodiprion fabricii TaxID=2872261 RepID=UPI001ED967DF|nr:uncharacterized protein LOC124176184 isoform X1 [Neodiprion fabricii]
MPHKCCVPSCKLQSDDPEGFQASFHKLPKDQDIQRKWLESINNAENVKLDPKKFMYVCSLHFKLEAFYYSGLCKLKRIKKDHYPSIFDTVKKHARNFSRNLPNHQDCQTKQQNDVPGNSIDWSANLQISHNSSHRLTTSRPNPVSSINDEEQQEPINAGDSESGNECPQAMNCMNTSSNENVNKQTEPLPKCSKCTQYECDSFIIGKNDATLIANTVLKRSVANIDLGAINTSNNFLLQQLVLKAQLEIRQLHKKNRNLRLKNARYCRSKKKFKDFAHKYD